MEKREQTQWAATYLVAAELTRRGYRVGWPMGNAPSKDLLVESRKGRSLRLMSREGRTNRQSNHIGTQYKNNVLTVMYHLRYTSFSSE